MEATKQSRSIDEVIEKYPPQREHLISILQEVQGEYGYLSRESIDRISGYLGLPPSKIFGVATFYNQFRLNAPGRIQVAVCRGTACHVKGSLSLLDTLKTLLEIEEGQTTKDGLFSLDTVACLGCCSIAPALMANGKFFGRLDKKKVEALVEQFRAAGRVEE
ncbi:MAG TPA: NADH-quinone oxidoreductase subunit NuoE [Spirochaetia bacterium]|nr:NADH-quinone oxidoreductase subunit NuoE [Spirochaetia bacterium]